MGRFRQLGPGKGLLLGPSSVRPVAPPVSAFPWFSIFSVQYLPVPAGLRHSCPGGGRAPSTVGESVKPWLREG